MERGNLEGAEPPLLKAYDAGQEEGALALADLYEARGDGAGASRLRWEALSLDKSTVEFALGLRIPWSGELGGALDVNVQPMGLGARRLTLGANLSFPEDLTLNATVGYQHFPYGNTEPHPCSPRPEVPGRPFPLEGSGFDSRRVQTQQPSNLKESLGSFLALVSSSAPSVPLRRLYTAEPDSRTASRGGLPARSDGLMPDCARFPSTLRIDEDLALLSDWRGTAVSSLPPGNLLRRRICG